VPPKNKGWDAPLAVVLGPLGIIVIAVMSSGSDSGALEERQILRDRQVRAGLGPLGRLDGRYLTATTGPQHVASNGDAGRHPTHLEDRSDCRQAKRSGSSSSGC